LRIGPTKPAAQAIRKLAGHIIKGKRETTDSGRERRYYSITSKGKQELAKQKAQLKELTASLNLVLGGALTPA